MVRYRVEVPAIEQYWDLFLTTGWNIEYHLVPKDLAQALQHSWYMVCAYDGDRLVGFGRVVSDTRLHAMIYDLIVAPGHQEQGIGSEILEQLVRRCRQEQICDIQLFCARGKRTFYEKRGFVARPDNAPGMQYVNKL